MSEHYLKTVQPYFSDVLNGKKAFEVRKNDRGGFAVGDALVLEEYIPMGEGYTGQAIIREVTYVLDSPKYCKPGYVVLGINNPTDAQRLALTADIPLDRLEAICAAEREGRCVVLDEPGVAGKLTALPCNVGDTAFALLDDSNEPGGWYICEYRVWGVCLKDDGWYLLDRDGNTDKIGTDYAYLTRDAAEAALRQK